VITGARPIASLDELRDTLQYAVGLELTTIPAYLCALYSIEPETNSAAAEVIQSVVLEEMLHMGLAANVLNAIGGVPSTAPVGGGPSPVPTYPATVGFIAGLPDIHLQPMSMQALHDFLAIEHPEEPVTAAGDGRYGSIGAFYAAIEVALREHCPPAVFEAARASRSGCQLPAHDYYGGAGTLIEVTDLDSAVAALTEIVREGEGVPVGALAQTATEHRTSGGETPGRLTLPYSVDDLDELPGGWKMYSHYARFAEIRAGRTYRPDQLIGEAPAGDVLPVDWRAVRPMTVDPRTEDFAGTPAYEPMHACDLAYTALVDTLYRGFNGERHALRVAVHAMYELKYRVAALLNTPSPLDPARTLGPAFTYLPG
jgi:hypothetical protein